MIEIARRILLHRRAPIRREVVPADAHWEWRIFRDTVPLPGRAVVEPVEPVVEETYFLSARSSFSVKIRADHLEIRRLERVDIHGFEQWRMIHDFSFPLSPAGVATVCVNLGVPGPELTQPVDAAALRDIMMALAPTVVVVPVLKVRTPFQFGGCRGEHVSLTIGAVRREMLALEGNDPVRLRTAVESLGYAKLANVNYPRGLKLACGIPRLPDRQPVIV